MKRELKFRAWSVSEGLMSEPFTFADVMSDESFGMATTPFIDVTTGIPVDQVNDESKYILMQFTGLKDKNGRDIYDGDIVKCHYFYQALGEGLGVYEAEQEIIGQIVIEEMGLFIDCKTEGDSGYLLLMNGLHEVSFEIIGNIHQNPNLHAQ